MSGPATTAPSVATRLWARRRDLRQFLRFGLVGGSGVLVNMAVVFLGSLLFPDTEAVAMPLLFGYNLRCYHLIATVAFLVANLSNYELNRRWTFRQSPQRGWWRGLLNFLAIGLAAFVVGLAILTALQNETSPLFLGRWAWFDNSSWLRRRFYWATVIQIVLTMPINYVANKLVTFRAVHDHRADDELPLLAPVVDPEEVHPGATPVRAESAVAGRPTMTR